MTRHFDDFRDMYGYGHDRNISLAEYDYRKHKYMERQEAKLQPLFKNYTNFNQRVSVESKIVENWTREMLTKWSIFDNMTCCTNREGLLPMHWPSWQNPIRADMKNETFTLNLSTYDFYDDIKPEELFTELLYSMGSDIMFNISEKYTLLIDQGYDIFPYIVLTYDEASSYIEARDGIRHLKFRHYYGTLPRGKYKGESDAPPFRSILDY